MKKRWNSTALLHPFMIIWSFKKTPKWIWDMSFWHPPKMKCFSFAGKIIMEMEPSKEPIPQIFSSKNLIIGSAGKPFWLPSDSAQQGVKLDSWCFTSFTSVQVYTYVYIHIYIYHTHICIYIIYKYIYIYDYYTYNYTTKLPFQEYKKWSSCQNMSPFFSLIHLSFMNGGMTSAPKNDGSSMVPSMEWHGITTACCVFQWIVKALM